MDIITEINRIKVARNKIRDKLVAWGVAKATDNITVLSQEFAKLKKHEGVSQKLFEGETYTILKGYHDGSGTVTAPVFCREIDMTDIADYQFKNGIGIEGAKTVILPNVETIGEGAFWYDSGVETIDIGESVKTIHYSAFNGCSNLKKLIFRGLWLAEEGRLVLGTTPIASKNGGYIYVPDEYLTQYKTAKDWIYWKDMIRPISDIEGGARLQPKTEVPGENQQIVTPDEGYYGLSQVTIQPIPADYKDVSDIDIDPNCVLNGIQYVDKTGYKTGSMQDIGSLDMVIDGENAYTTVAQGYTGGGVIRFNAPFSGAVYPWKTIDSVAVADRQFANGIGIEDVRTLVLPNVETIGTAAFISAQELEVIDIGDKVQSIHFAAFNTCSKLRKLIFRGLWIPTEKKLALTGTQINSKVEGAYIYVPDEYLTQYQKATYWAEWHTAGRIKPISEL